MPENQNLDPLLFRLQVDIYRGELDACLQAGHWGAARVFAARLLDTLRCENCFETDESISGGIRHLVKAHDRIANLNEILAGEHLEAGN